MTTVSTASAGLLACASILALSLAQPAQADSYLAFGDSLSDTGNAFALTGGAFPDSRFYHEGRLSDGAIWVDRLAGEHVLMADLLTGTVDRDTSSWNFAVAGATTGADFLDPVAGTPPGLRAQVDMARAMAKAGQIGIGRDTTAVLWAGANDHGMWLTSPERDPSLDGAVTAATVANIDGATRDIARSGVGRVAVLNLWDFSLAPTTALLPEAVREAGDAMSAEHNRLLLAAAEAADTGTEAQVVLVDVDALFDEIAADPAAWGFETLAPCLPDGGAPVCEEPGSADSHVFWDSTHLTSAAHQLVAGAVEGTLSAASELPLLSAEATEFAFALTDEHRRRQEAVALTAGDDLGIVVEVITTDVQAGHQTGRGDGVAAGLTLGSGVLTYGALGSWQQASTEGDESTIEAEAWSGSAFVSYGSGPLSVTGQFGASRADFDLERDTAFAPASRARGEAGATTRYADVGLSYSLASTGAVEIGLSGGLTWAETRRDGWDETGGLMAGAVEEQTRETLTARLGVDASATTQVGGLDVTGFGSVRYTELLRESVEGGEVTLASGQDFAAADIDDRDGLEVEVGVSTRLTEVLEISTSYRARSGQDDWRDGTLSAALVGRF